MQSVIYGKRKRALRWTPDAPICYAVGSGGLAPCKIAFHKSLPRPLHEALAVTSLNMLPLQRKRHLASHHIKHGTDQETVWHCRISLFLQWIRLQHRCMRMILSQAHAFEEVISTAPAGGQRNEDLICSSKSNNYLQPKWSNSAL